MTIMLDVSNDNETYLSFIQTKSFLISTIIRLCFACRIFISHNIRSWITSPILRSVLVNPIHTLDHVVEADAVRGLQQSTSILFADAYRDGQIHLPPLLLAFIEFFHAQSFWTGRYNAAILRITLIGVDVLIAYKLQAICIKLFEQEEKFSDERIIQEQMSKKIYPDFSNVFQIDRKSTEYSVNHEFQPNPTEEMKNIELPSNPQFLIVNIPSIVANLYYLSPFTILASNAMGSFQCIRVLLLCSSILQALNNGPIVWIAFCLALASYFDIHLTIFIVPILLIVDKQKRQRHKTFTLLLFFIIYTASLHYISFLLVGLKSREYFKIFATTHGYSFRLYQQEPSLTTLWYLSMELFGRFRLYFTILIGGIPYILVAPTTIRLFQYPGVLISLYWMIGVLFRPPSTLYDLNIGLCFMMCCPRSLARMPRKIAIVSLCALPVPVCLYILTYSMWLGPNTGEANFVYFQCLGYNVFVSLIFLTFTSASLVRDKALRITRKGIQL